MRGCSRARSGQSTGLCESQRINYQNRIEQPVLPQMTTPILTILLKDQFPRCLAFVEALVRVLGFQLEHPVSGKITCWTSDGTQFEVSREGIADAGAQNVQFWQSPTDDLFVSWTGTSSGFRFSFYLNGLPIESRLALANGLVQAVLTDLSSQFCEECAFQIEFD